MKVNDRKMIIKSALRSYVRMTKNVRKSLKQAGITVENATSHYILKVENQNNNTKGIFFLPSTSSDWRAGRNISSEICRFLSA